MNDSWVTLLQVEKRLKELEGASNTTDLLNSFKNLGNDLMDLAKLSGKRQAVSKTQDIVESTIYFN